MLPHLIKKRTYSDLFLDHSFKKEAFLQCWWFIHVQLSLAGNSLHWSLHLKWRHWFLCSFIASCCLLKVSFTVFSFCKQNMSTYFKNLQMLAIFIWARWLSYFYKTKWEKQWWKNCSCEWIEMENRFWKKMLLLVLH